jgi:hypothetical protein
MALIDLIDQKAFLGTEFVTWLWFRSEQENPEHDIEGIGDCEVFFEKDLVLASEAGQATASTLRGETPSLAPEAVAALLAGKKVKRARVILTAENTTWQLTLNAETFDWGGLKIDTPPSLPFEEAVPIRMNALEVFQRIFDGLYSAFLDTRLDEKTWATELEAIHAWVLARESPAEEE